MTSLRSMLTRRLFDAIDANDTELLLKFVSVATRAKIALNTMRNDHGRSLLFVACAKRRYQLVKRLLALGCRADEYCTDGATPLTHAVVVGDRAMVKLLLKHGASPDKPTMQGAMRTPLMLAAAMGNTKMARQLVKYGANPWIATPDGLLATAFASSANREAIASTIQKAMHRVPTAAQT